MKKHVVNAALISARQFVEAATGMVGIVVLVWVTYTLFVGDHTLTVTLVAN